MSDAGACCGSCGRRFDGSHGYLDLRPRTAFDEQTKYLDETLHADARHTSVGPPLLGSRIRNDMLRRFLRLRSGDRVLDLGCGSGRAMIWNAGTGASMTGVDISPYFARESIARCDLILGDLRRLPLGDSVFDKAWSLDVFEHLSKDALRSVLAEANRVLKPGGRLFVYTHVRKNGWIAGGVRAINRLAGALERTGVLDLRQERLRKSDHVNPLADHTELKRVVKDAGFEIERLTFYTPVIGAAVENILARIVEQWLTRRARQGGATQASAAQTARATGKAQVQSHGAAYWSARALTAAMKLDVILFGRFKSGPFFALLTKPAPSSQRPPV
jgi:SAM-dependent methyltransferase